MPKYFYVDSADRMLTSRLFEKVCAQQNPRHLVDPTATVLAFDPGETTGVAVVRQGRVIMYGQLDTHKMDAACLEAISNCIVRYTPALHEQQSSIGKSHFKIIIEDYLVYSWKGEQHEWAKLHTSQLIGFIQAACVLRAVPVTLRKAQMAKAFFKDEMLKRFGWYVKGARHARDAIRHCGYEILFGDQAKLHKVTQGG